VRSVTRVSVMVVFAMFGLSCGDQNLPFQSNDARPVFEIQDGVHGSGNGHFFFLPPVVPQSKFNGTFDGTESPIVTICQLGTSTCAPVVAQFSMTSGTGAEVVRVDPANQLYTVNWRTDQCISGPCTLPPTNIYRIRASVAGTELGHADVKIISSQKDSKNVNSNEYFPLVNGRTLPIKFRIERGAVFVVGATGGTIAAIDGAVKLTVPAGALPQAVGITVQPLTASELPAVFRGVLGSAFDFGPNGTTFAQPVTLTVSYDPSRVPLGLARLDNGHWVRLAGTSTNVATKTVSSSITHFTDFALVYGAPGMVVTPSGATINAIGGTQTFTAQVLDFNSSPISGKTFTWESLNPSIATINPSTGVATAISSGQVTIATTSDGETGYALLTVAALGAHLVNLWVPMAGAPSAPTAVGPIWGTSATNVYVDAGGTELFRYDGTNWLSVLSTGGGLSRLWGSSPVDVYGAGDPGVFHFNGNSWNQLAGLTSSGGSGLWGSSPRDVYVLPNGTGTVFHFDGLSWTEADDAPFGCNAMWGTSASEMLANCNGGRIYEFDGFTWTPISSPTTQDLGGIWGTSSFDIYMIGWGGTFLHYDGSAWSPIEVPADVCATSNCILDAIWGSSDEDIYLVGELGGTILHYDGTTFTRLASGTTSELDAVWGTREGDVYVAQAHDANGTVLRGIRGATVAVSPPSSMLTGIGDGKQLNATAFDPSGHPINGVNFTWTSSDPRVATVSALGVVTTVGSGTATITAMAPGGAAGAATVTVTTEWTSIPTGISGYLDNIWGASGTDVFAVGEGGLILHFDGTSWVAMVSGNSEELLGVWGTSGTDVFAVGVGGTILHHDGTSWGLMASGTTNQLDWVWGVSGTDVYAVGPHGVVLHYTGSAWDAMTSGTSEELTAVWGASGEDVFAVGEAGTVIHYNGSSWTQMISGTAEKLYGVWGTSGNDVYASGNGVVLHYDGTAWSPELSGSFSTMRIWGSSNTNIYAVGLNGVILHKDFVDWNEVPSGTGAQLTSVWGASSADIYAVGQGGTILHRSQD